MSVAPGSGVGSFRVLYIALIYMSLEINLAYTLPRHPPPLQRPSGHRHHLPLALASISPSPSLLLGRWWPGCPTAAPAAVGVWGSPPGALSPGAAAGWAGRDGGDSCWGRGDMARGASWGTGCWPRAAQEGSMRGH